VNPAAADWAAMQYRPAPGTPLLTCWCGAVYLDDQPARAAHRTVFGHHPAPDSKEDDHMSDREDR